MNERYEGWDAHDLRDHLLQTERERDEAVALLREAQNYVIDVSDYPGAGHPYKQAANDCWQRIDAFLAKLEAKP